MTASLIGNWKLQRDGSDLLPGLDNYLPNSPLVLKLSSNRDDHFFQIEKKKFIDVEEVHFTYTSKSRSVTRRYQLGTLTYETVQGSNVILGSIQSVTESFSELVIQRYGPKTGQTRFDQDLHHAYLTYSNSHSFPIAAKSTNMTLPKISLN